MRQYLRENNMRMNDAAVRLHTYSCLLCCIIIILIIQRSHSNCHKRTVYMTDIAYKFVKCSNSALCKLVLILIFLIIHPKNVLANILTALSGYPVQQSISTHVLAFNLSIEIHSSMKIHAYMSDILYFIGFSLGSFKI